MSGTSNSVSSEDGSFLAETETKAPTRRRARVLGTRPEGRDAVRLEVLVEGLWTHRPGQVAELAVQPGEEGFFAIASPPDDGPHLTFLVRSGGSLSEPLMSLPVGADLWVAGPYGRGYDLDEVSATPTPLLLVGMGSALGALRAAMLETLAHRNHLPVVLLLGVRSENDVAFADEMDRWLHLGVEVHLVSSRGPGRLRGHVQDHLPAIAARYPGALVLVAGSEELENDVSDLLGRQGVPALRIQRNFRPDGRSLFVGPGT